VNVIEGRFDKRATHRIFSEPVALDLVNDLTALTDEAGKSDNEALRYLEACHMLALGTGDADLVRGLVIAHARVSSTLARLQGMRELTRIAAGLVEQSIRVNPFVAVEYAALEAA
jgi:hypothetical protein